MTTLEAQEEYILDAFVNGLHNVHLENETLTAAYEQAYTCELAIHQSSSYFQPDTVGAALKQPVPTIPPPYDDSTYSPAQDVPPLNTPEQPVTAASTKWTCYYCGLNLHS